jgi:hypothetical protein
MKPFLAATLALLALAGCSSGTGDGGRSEAQRQLPLAPTEVTLTHSNVSELDGQTAIRVTMELVGGNTVVTIPAITSWPVQNGFLGLDHFFYGASGLAHPVIRVKDQGCDEPVVGVEACGWKVNHAGCTASGFGCFASKKSAGPASHGATTQDLVFVLRGDVTFAANDHGAMFAVHGRFTEDCSGWFSDGTASSVQSNARCTGRCGHTCSLSVEPDALDMLRGSWGTATVTVTESGPAPAVPITLSVNPLSLPAGVTVGLAPNPVNPPGASMMTVQTTPSAPLGTTQIVITGEGQEATGEPFRCRTTLELTILPPPPPQPGACYCPDR